MSPEWPDLEQFEQLFIEQLDALPDAMVEKLDNVVFLAQDRPDDDEQILGVYEGVALTERATTDTANCPTGLSFSASHSLKKSRHWMSWPTKFTSPWSTKLPTISALMTSSSTTSGGLKSG